MMLLAFPEYLPQAQRLAEALGIPLTAVAVHRFPDGESLVRLPPSLPAQVIVCRSLNQPNDKLLELLMCARAARGLGAQQLILVAPYLCYMRQDIANHPGEAVSQRIVGQFLAELFDALVTVDPHLHRIANLRQAVPLKAALAVSASGAIAAFLKRRLPDALLLGPDIESRQWVEGIAAQVGCEYAVANKIREGDRQVEVQLPHRNYRGLNVVIVDDMASTGRTAARAATALLQAGANQVYLLVTHALFCGDAERHILSAGVAEIWSTDSIAHPSSVIHLDRLLAETLRSVLV